MRRATMLAAAIAAAASITLIAPTAHAATAGQRLTAVSSCDSDGHIKLASNIDAAGIQHVKATVTQVKEKRWAGQLVLRPDEADIGDTVGPEMEKFVAKHGGFSTAAQLPGATSLDALGTFASHDLRSMCDVEVVQHRDNKFAAIGIGAGVALRTGPKPTVLAFAFAQQHHRYHFAFTVRTKAGTKRWSLNRTATDKFGIVQARTRDLKHLASFTEAAVTITDLTHRSDSASFKLTR